MFEALRRFRASGEGGRRPGFQGKPRPGCDCQGQGRNPGCTCGRMEKKPAGRGQPRGRRLQRRPGELGRVGELIRRFLGQRGKERARKPGPAKNEGMRELLERMMRRRMMEGGRVPKRGKHPKSAESGF